MKKKALNEGGVYAALIGLGHDPYEARRRISEEHLERKTRREMKTKKILKRMKE